MRKYSLGDYLATVVGFIGLAVPNFFFALILMYLSYIWFGETLGGLFSPEFENAHWSLAAALGLPHPCLGADPGPRRSPARPS